MKISELIHELEAAQKYIGDIEVVYSQDTYNGYFPLTHDYIKAVYDKDSNGICLTLNGED